MERLAQSLDSQGLVNWLEPLENGQPLLHCLVAQQFSPTLFIEQALRRHPELVMSHDTQGGSLWDATWRLRFDYANRLGQSVKQVLRVIVELAPESCYGTTEADKQAFLLKAMRLNDHELSKALEKRLGHVPVEEEILQAVWPRLNKGNWPLAMRAAGDINGVVALTEQVKRPLWRIGLARGLFDAVAEVFQSGQTPAATPEQKAWLDLADLLKKEKPQIATLKKVQALFFEGGFDQGLATSDDLGRPAGWHLLRRSPHLLREMTVTQMGRAMLMRQDDAGHTVAFYVSPHLDDADLLRQKLGYLTQNRLHHGFTTAIGGRGLLAQRFADPEAWTYALYPNNAGLPNLMACLAQSSLDHTTYAFMEEVFTSEGMWALLPGDAERIVANWMTQPALMTTLPNFLHGLIEHQETNRCLMESDLGPYVPALRALVGLCSSFKNNNAFNTAWMTQLDKPWPALPVSTDQVMHTLQQLKPKAPIPGLDTGQAAFLAKLRHEVAQREHGPTQTHRARYRS